MKTCLRMALLTIVLVSGNALADSLYLAVNYGSGDNFSNTGTFNGHTYTVSGGTTFDFFGSQGYSPGAPFGGEDQLFLYSTTLSVGGEKLVFSFPSATIFMTSFTLPTNGLSFFTVPVDVSFSAFGENEATGQTVDLEGGASGSISFDLGAGGLYYPNDFVQASPPTVPEPGTLTLLGTGLIGIGTAARNRLKRVRSVQVLCIRLAEQLHCRIAQ